MRKPLFSFQPDCKIYIVTIFYILYSTYLICECREINSSRDNIKIAILGDTRSELIFEKFLGNRSYVKLNHIANYIGFVNPDIILHTGDIVKLGSKKSEWNMFSKVFDKFIQQSPPKFFPVIGNHELDMIEEVGLKNYFETFKYLHNKRWYCVYINKRILILNLDSNFKKLDKKSQELQDNFIKSTLQQFNGKYKLLLTNFHHPIYRNLYNFKLRKSFIQNFQKHFDNIKTHMIYINGHYHNFLYRKIHSKSRVLITGGAGAPLHKFVQGLLNKHHLVILRLNLSKNTVKINLLIFKSPRRFYFKKIDKFSF